MQKNYKEKHNMLKSNSFEGTRSEEATVISRGVKIEGKLSCSGSIRLDGEVQGDISSQSTVIVGENGKVNGQINAESITIGGKVTGTIRAKEKVMLESKGNLKGDIITKTLSVDAGAVFNGNTKMGESGNIGSPIETSKPQDSTVK
jgi:cytoskeletal protein CcmA (bactofilin family)